MLLPRLRPLALLFAFTAVVCLSHAAEPKKILFFTKSSGFEHEVISYKNGRPSHAENVLLTLGAKHGWEFTFSKDGSLFSPEYLKRFAAVFFYTSGNLLEPGTDKQPPMTLAGKQALLDYVSEGGGFLGAHSATDSFHTNNESQKGPGRYKNFGPLADPYVRMIGGEFIKHGDQQKARLRCASPAFPGLEHLADGCELHEEWYSLKDFREDLHVLLVQETDGMKGLEYQRPAFPSTWVRTEGKGRVFYTSLGHRRDIWTNPVFQGLLVAGIRWTLGETQTDVDPNIDQVTPGWATNPPFPGAPAKSAAAP
jgi:type 1 glutamine amidotransferase